MFATAMWLRRGGNDESPAPPPAAEVDYAAISSAACPPLQYKTVKVPCPPIECTTAEKQALQAQVSSSLVGPCSSPDLLHVGPAPCPNICGDT